MARATHYCGSQATTGTFGGEFEGLWIDPKQPIIAGVRQLWKLSVVNLRVCGLTRNPNPKPYLEDQGDLVSRLITPITHIITLLIPIINLLTKSP